MNYENSTLKKEEQNVLSLGEFAEVIRNCVNQKLSKCMVKVISNQKLNGDERTALYICSPDTNVSPMIYLETFYEQYLEGETVEMITTQIVTFYQKIKPESFYSTKNIENFEIAKKRLEFKLINAKQNQELLKSIPHRLFLDLAVVYYLLFEKDEQSIITMQIRNDHMMKWGVSEDELYQIALKKMKPRFYSIEDIIGQLVKNEIDDIIVYPMYVLTNSFKQWGAVSIVYNEVLEIIGDILGNDFYILPSSVHEVIILPCLSGIEKKELDEMIQEINRSAVAPEDILENHSYLYQRKEKRIIW